MDRQTFCRLFGVPAWMAVLRLIAALAMVSATRMSAADIEEIVTAKVMRVGLPADENPPYIMGAPGSPLQGLEGDLIAEIAKRLGVRAEFVRTARSPKELLAQLADSRVDLAIGQLPDSLEWARTVRFTRPYLLIREVCLVDRLTSAKAGGFERLIAGASARIAVPASSAVLPSAREEFGDRILVSPTLAAAVNLVLSRAAAGAMVDEVSAARWLEDNPVAGLRIESAMRRDRRTGLAIAVSWSSEELHAWINLCLEKCVLDGTMNSLIAKNLGPSWTGRSR